MVSSLERPEVLVLRKRGLDKTQDLEGLNTNVLDEMDGLHTTFLGT